jgi:nucleoside-diphosphate-sugar epimerase
VLGASGFIGRWVARTLNERGAKTYVVVRDQSAAEAIFSAYGIHGDLFEVDLRDRDAVRRLYEKVRPSITFNLAGYGVDRSECDETTAYEINAHLVRFVGEVVAEIRDTTWPGQDLVHVGSALEYGTIGGHLGEDSKPNPTTLYGKSKLAGTLALADCCRTGGIEALTARLFTVYGPGEHRGRLLPSLLEAYRTGQRLQLTAGDQEKDFTYVEDVAEGLLHLGLAKAQPGEIVNLATGTLVSVRGFAEAAARVLRMPAEHLLFGTLPSRADDMKHSTVEVARLRGLTDWIPSTKIDEGIRRTRDFEVGKT